MAGQLQEKVAVVTGGSRGIGRATALAMAREGAKVVIASRSVAEGEDTVRLIVNSGGTAQFVKTDVTQTAEIAIVPVVGAEAITGSSRMKAGTAQKLILNMISTVSMIHLGYVKGNRMTNVKASNIKLKERSLRILMSETGLDETVAKDLMTDAGEDLRVAIVMFRAKVDAEKARVVLSENDFVVEKSVELLNTKD
ncbi:MAG: SDR family NAD(P)-dependent oxidoreductase [Blastocatellia bacterium]|nr:SDR family NAD(P)-dependent oxidoreductase [Blastocatellia bacterium]